MIAALATAAAAALGGAPADADVVMSARRYSPADLTVLTGAQVRWRNDDHEDHNVHGNGFDSGMIAPGGAFATSFERPGQYAYRCSIHRTMTGTISVVALGLTGPSAPVKLGDAVTLEALVPEGVEQVTLERLDGSGAVAVASPDESGRARFSWIVDGPGRYRARAGSLTSAPVTVRVAASMTASVVRHGRRMVHVEASVSPDRPGGTVVLERYVRERFDWLPLRRARWAGGSAPIEFALRTRRSPRLRVRVPAAAGGWAESVSSGARPVAGHH